MIKGIKAIYYANFYTPKRIQPQAIPEFHFMKESPVAKKPQSKNTTQFISQIIKFFKRK